MHSGGEWMKSATLQYLCKSANFWQFSLVKLIFHWGGLLLWAISSSAVAVTDILVLQSHDSAPYQQTLAGFRLGLAKSKLDINYQVLNIPDSSDVNFLQQQLQTHQPSLILTLGTPATRVAMLQGGKIPIIAGMVLETDELRQNSHTTGVGLNFPISEQWQWLRRLLPDARQVAVILDPQQGTSVFPALQKLAQAEGVTLIPAPASHAEDFSLLMQNLPSQLDALWAVEGASAYNAAAVRELLLYSFRNRVPLIGLSAQWVKAGALYALDWDFSDLGLQTAELAKSILLQGSAPSSLIPQTPHKARLVLNLKTADHMKLQISERLLSEMSEVFQ